MANLIQFCIGVATIVLIVNMLYCVGVICAKTKYSFLKTEKVLEGETGLTRFFLLMVNGFYNLLILIILITICIILYHLIAQFGEWVHVTFFN